MRYLAVFKGGKEGTPPSEHEMAEMGKLIGEMAQAGVLLAAEGCQPSAKGVRVRASNGKFTVIDGPFTESKELIGGFCLFQVTSKAEAIDWTKRFLEVGGDGECEVRELYDVPAFDPSSQPQHAPAAAKR